MTFLVRRDAKFDDRVVVYSHFQRQHFAATLNDVTSTNAKDTSEGKIFRQKTENLFYYRGNIIGL